MWLVASAQLAEPPLTGPAAALRELHSLAVELDAAGVAEDARALAERTAEGRFYVAAVGQFKRGKSTLVNALIGAPVLPTAVTPVTTVPTIVQFGPAAARVRLASGGWHVVPPATLAAYVAEEHNPENRKGVQAVEVFVPSPLLADGMCLVDTPGLGSPFAANAASTRAFVPHVDAVIVVLGADPPISGEELDLIAQAREQTPHLLFVLNKADRVSDAELAEAKRFTRRLVQERLRMDAEPILAVSALESSRPDDGVAPEGVRDWKELRHRLVVLARDSGRALVAAAIARGVERIGARLGALIDEELGALERPLGESEARIISLSGQVQEAERALLELGPRFAAEEARLGRLFSERRTAFLQGTQPAASRVLADRIDEMRGLSPRKLRPRAFDAALEIARVQLADWLGESEREAEAAYGTAMRRLAGVANDVLGRLRVTAPWAAAALPLEVEEVPAIRTGPRFHFHELLGISMPVGLAWVARQLRDVIRPFSAGAHVRQEAQQYLGLLLDVNATRVQYDLAARVAESRRQLEHQLGRALADAHAAAVRALDRARLIHAEGREAVAQARERLVRLRQRVARARGTELCHGEQD